VISDRECRRDVSLNAKIALDECLLQPNLTWLFKEQVERLWILDN
jgi:hypothetical protein